MNIYERNEYTDFEIGNSQKQCFYRPNCHTSRKYNSFFITSDSDSST